MVPPPGVTLPTVQPVTAVTQPVDIGTGGKTTTGPLTVEVPPQVKAGVSSVSLSVQPVTTLPSFPAGAMRGSAVADITLKDQTGARIVESDKGVKLSFRYTDADLALAGGDANNLAILRFDEAKAAWERLAVTVDTVTKVVTAETKHFSVFTLLIVPAPTLTGPSEGLLSFDLAPLLSWSNPAGTSQYQIQVIPFNNDGPGINLIRDVETAYQLQAPRIGVGNYVLLPDMAYTWRVRTTSAAVALSENDPWWSGWISRTFRTASTVSWFITPVGPAVGTTVASLTPTIAWDNLSKQIFYYEVQISKDPSFGLDAFLYWELRHGGVTQPQNSYTVPSQYPLEAATTYYWRVRPRIQGDGVPVSWSDVWGFQTPGPGG